MPVSPANETNRRLWSPDHAMRHRHSTTALALTTVLLVACDSDDFAGGSRPGDILASAVIGSAGGDARVQRSPVNPYDNCYVSVQPGVVGQDTEFTIAVDATQATLPDLFLPIRFEPADRDFSTGQVELNVRYTDRFATIDPLIAPADPRVFLRRYPDRELRITQTLERNESDRALRVEAPHLGTALVTNAEFYRLFHQEQRLVDPATPEEVEPQNGTDILVAGGSQTATVGQGSIASFFSSTSQDNLLILHGLGSNPLEFRMAEDLEVGLAADYANIVYFQYPSAASIAANANALYDLIVASAQPGFSCDIVAHSMGGLVARYALERAAEDQNRGGFSAGDAPLSGLVAHLIMIATPNAGASIRGAQLSLLESVLDARDERYLTGYRDLQAGAGSFTSDLNGFYANNPTLYFNIAGNIGGDTDGIVSNFSSNGAITLVTPEESVIINDSDATHSGLHKEAMSLGVLDHIRDFKSR